MSVLRREVFYSMRGGQFKFLDWARTTTTLGVCAEPFNLNAHYSHGGTSVLDLDPSDPMTKVNGLVRVGDEGDVKRALFDDGGRPIHGGNMHPRVLIFTGNVD